MAGINKVTLVGRVGQAPEVKQVGESKVAKFSLATSEKYKNKQGESVEDTEWHNLEIWGKLADVAEKYVNQGDLLYIEGKIKTDKWEKDGQKQSMTKIRVLSLQMLGSKQANGQSNPSPIDVKQGGAELPSDDLPF